MGNALCTSATNPRRHHVVFTSGGRGERKSYLPLLLRLTKVDEALGAVVRAAWVGLQVVQWQLEW